MSCLKQTGNFPNMTKSDSVSLCFHFLPYQVKLGFPILVDEYTILEIPDSYSFFTSKNPEQHSVMAQLDVFPQYSDASVYSVKSSKIVNNVMHLVIKLNEGKLESFRWENGCFGCNITSPANCKDIKTSFIEFASEKNKEITQKVCTTPYCSASNS